MAATRTAERRGAPRGLRRGGGAIAEVGRRRHRRLEAAAVHLAAGGMWRGSS